MEKLKEHIQQIGFPELKVKRASISTSKKNVILLKRNKENWILFFKRIDKEDNSKIIDCYPYLKSISFPNNYDVVKILYDGLWLSYQYLIDKFLRLKQNKIKEIIISNEEDGFKIVRNKLYITPAKMAEVIGDAKGLQTRAKSHRNSYETYEGNKLLLKYLNIKVEKSTLINKGDFNFLVDRLNLKTKSQKKDFDKYIDKTDIQSLQGLFQSFVDYEMFQPEFLRKLNDYFIKEKLTSIIKIGRELLKLKSDDIKSVSAKDLIHQISPDLSVGQLETLWQRYFERNLLYLIFTYQKIYPKVQLKITDDKKFPDFIGINHYGGVDIIEIKTHLTPALTYDKNHKNFAFSNDLSKAIIQTMNYVDALQHGKIVNVSDKEKLEQENMYRPQTIIIISSNNYIVRNKSRYKSSEIERDFTKLRNSLSNIEIVTFDEIIETADRYQKNMID